MSTLIVHGFHTDCGECGYKLLSPESIICSECGTEFTHVQTECMYKIGKPEFYGTIEEWDKRD